MKEEFERIFKAYYTRLYTLAFRMVGNAEDAQEVIQNSFLNAFKGYHRYRGESSTYTWLYRIVYNSGKKYWQEIKKLPVLEYAEQHHLSEEQVYAYINGFGVSAEKLLIEQVKQSCLQIFMDCMPKKYRVVFTLRQILGLSVGETAEIIGINENTVKVNLHRAKKVIAGHLAGRCSLIKPGSMCDCRLFAQFLRKTNDSLSNYPDIKVIEKKERKAQEQINSELKEILQLEDLYDNYILPPDYPKFIERVKSLSRDKNFKLLNYD